MLHSVHQDAYFELSKTVFGPFLKLFIIRESRGVQKLPDVNKRFLKNSEKKFLNRGQNGTRKCVVVVLSVIYGALMDTLQGRACDTQHITPYI